MTGVKLGDRLLHVGCANGGRLAAIAAKTGLSGNAAAVVPDEPSAARARKGAADAGVLVEIEVAPPTRLPHEADSFDVAVVDDTAGILASLATADRRTSIRELIRILRPGGRAMIIGAGKPAGLGRFFGGQPGPSFIASGDATSALEAEGFTMVRTLAERDGLVFVEGVKPRQAGGAG